MRRLAAIFAVLVLCFSITVAAQDLKLLTTQDRKIFTVGTASAARGHKAIGVIEVPAGNGAAPSTYYLASDPCRSVFICG